MTKLEQARKLIAEAKADKDNRIPQSYSLHGTAAELKLADVAVRQYSALLDVVEAAKAVHERKDHAGRPVAMGLLSLAAAVRKWEELA